MDLIWHKGLSIRIFFTNEYNTWKTGFSIVLWISLFLWSNQQLTPVACPHSCMRSESLMHKSKLPGTRLFKLCFSRDEIYGWLKSIVDIHLLVVHRLFESEPSVKLTSCVSSISKNNQSHWWSLDCILLTSQTLSVIHHPKQGHNPLSYTWKFLLWSWGQLQLDWASVSTAPRNKAQFTENVVDERRAQDIEVAFIFKINCYDNIEKEKVIISEIIYVNKITWGFEKDGEP